MTAPYHISFIVGLHLRAEATDIYSLSRCCIRKKLTNKDQKKTSVTPNCEEEKNTSQCTLSPSNCCLTGFKLAQFFRQDLVCSSGVYSRDILYNYKDQASSPFDHSETVHLVSNAI